MRVSAPIGRWCVLASTLVACSSSSELTGEPDARVESDASRPAPCVAQDTALQAVLDRERHDAPNAMLAVRNETCGTAVYLSGDPQYAARDSLWRVYSITKTFVSAAILSLVGEGALALDDSLSRWVPDVPRSEGVTIAMLLDHRSGLPDFLERGVWAPMWRQPCTPEQLVDAASRSFPYSAPDSEFHYSNTNYILLGMVLEAVTGERAGRVLHERAIDVAGLHDTFLDGFEPVAPERMARGFHGFTSFDYTFWVDPSCAWTAGAMVMTGADLVDWVAALYGSDRVLDASRRAMLTARVSEVPEYGGLRYGLGAEIYDEAFWAPQQPRSGAGIGHSGRWAGFVAIALYFPERTTAVATVINDDSRTTETTAIQAAALSALFP